MEAEQRPATAQEQAVLARWSSWGAIPEVFDDSKLNWTSEREMLRDLLTEAQFAEARRTTINAHYTDPAYVREIWDTLLQLGFAGGKVLEPGSGSGTFIGLAPESAQMVGVELDSTTATIAAALYPHAEFRAESFAATKLPPGLFDAAVGNVPFADVQLHDPEHNAGRHSLHNHFIIKSLGLTRPGGLVAVLSSHYTLDSQNGAARRQMNELADLVGAVRLPSGAHRRSAGTEVVTDLLIFRRREPGEPPASLLWEGLSAREIDGHIVKVNSYFDRRPEHILGAMSVTTGMYGSETLQVSAEDLARVPERLRTALQGVVVDAAHQGQRMTPRSAESAWAIAEYRPAEPGQWDGIIVAQDDGTFTVVAAGAHQPLTVPKSTARELRALLQLRDGASRLLEAEAASPDNTVEIVDLRLELQRNYTAYHDRFGALNRFSLRPTGKIDEETGEPRMARIRPTSMRFLRMDPFGPLVLALERFDEASQTATPAALLKQRVVLQRPVVLQADTPSEAIAISLDQHGRVELSTVAKLLTVDEATARAQLGQMVFDDPDSGELVHAPDYLSGNVRTKLDAARQAAQEHPDRFTVNVSALERVIPEPLTMEQIQPSLGAVWISADDHQDFLRTILRDSTLRVENPTPGMWEVRGVRQSVRATSEWGTTRRPATDIAQAVMEQRTLAVYDDIEDGDRTRRVFNPLETTAAQEKAELMAERFAEWVWEDPDRATRLATEYNRRFNSIVLRNYSQEGDYLTMPGLAASFEMRPHQRAAIARAIAEPTAGFFHSVGAGKTAEMVASAMELRRMGLINKPAVVVPNHMLDQFAREWVQLYPQARILAASSDDLAGEKRRLFVARAAANDWDAVIMTRTAFQRIPLSPATEAEYIAGEVEQLRSVLSEQQTEDRMSVKRIERRVLKLEEKMKGLVDKPRDPGISFESTGIDYLIVDEMHDYKNLATESNIQGAGIAGSVRATDLHSKFEYLRSQPGDHVGIAATATPLANSVTEAYVMQRYLRPDLLNDAGLNNFDAWAATFGQTVTEMEMAPTGGDNFRIKTRFAKFQNVPEMLRMWHVFADVKTAEDLDLAVPLVRERADGRRLPETVVLPPTAELEDYIAAIGERAEAVSRRIVTPDVDNMLKISTDGRKAALDIRMVDQHARPTGYTKLNAVAARIHSEWAATRQLQFVDGTGQVSPITGGLQLAFSDLGTPSERWNAYDEIKLKLIERGIPGDSIRFIHEAKNNTEKERLFEAARAGTIAVLLGSTSKMGVGTNIQDRMTAIHDIDCPWRPADVEQRQGRGVRQGNQNAEIGLYRYVVERSFDAYMWQTVERKAKFIAQIMRGTLDAREIDDVGDAALSAAETKALSSGNPLILEQSIVTNEVAKLERLERAWHRNQSNLHFIKSNAMAQADATQQQAVALRAALPKIIDTSDDRFRITVRGRTFDRRTEAAAAIVDWTAQHGLAYLPAGAERALGELGELSGFTIYIRATAALGKVNLVAQLRDAPGASVSLPRDELRQGGLGFVRMLENRVATLPRLLTDTEARHAAAVATAQEAELSIGAPFKHADELAAARQRATQVNAQLAELTKTNDEKVRTDPAMPPATDGTLREKADRVLNRPSAASSRTSEPSRAPFHERGPRH